MTREKEIRVKYDQIKRLIELYDLVGSVPGINASKANKKRIERLKIKMSRVEKNGVNAVRIKELLGVWDDFWF